MTAEMIRLWIIVIAGFIITVVFGFMGWIGGWGIGLGITGVIGTIITLQNIPQRSVVLLTKIFLAWLTVCVILPGLYGAFTKKAPPTTDDPAEMQARMAEISKAQRARPPMLGAMEGFFKAANQLDDQLGQAYGQEARGLVNQHPITAGNGKNIQEKLFTLAEKIDESKKIQKEMNEKVLGEEKSVSSFRILIWMLSFVGIAALVISPVVQKKKDAIASTTWKVIAIIFVMFLFDKLVYAQTIGKPSTPNLPSMPSFGNMPSGEVILWAVVIVFFVLLVVAALSGKGKAWLILALYIVACVIGFAMYNFSDWFYHGGKAADVANHQKLVATLDEVQKRKEELAPQPADRKGHYNHPVPKRQGLAQTVTINLDEVHWSHRIDWSRDYNVDWKMPGRYEIMLSTGDRIINKNNGTTDSDLITYIYTGGGGNDVSYPNSMEFRRPGEVTWFIVRGAPGIGTVTVYDQ